MTPPTPAEVGQRIAAERLRLGLTQTAAAEKLGCSRSQVTDWEVRGANPTLATMLRFRAAGFDLRRVAPELYA